MSASNLTIASNELRYNPYAKYLTQTLADRCAALQREEADGHWASLRAELDLARNTLVDTVQFYAGAHSLPMDVVGRLETIMQAGALLRTAIDEISTLAVKAAKVESELKDKHDPRVTLQFIQQTVSVVDHRLREAERLGVLNDADSLIQQITSDVGSEVRLPDSTPYGLNAKPASVTPATADGMVRRMIDTVPLAS